MRVLVFLIFVLLQWAANGFQCFNERRELRTAIESYLADSSPTSVVANTYGYPIGSWCVSKVTSMAWLFSDLSAFNLDISAWNVSQVQDSK